MRSHPNNLQLLGTGANTHNTIRAGLFTDNLYTHLELQSHHHFATQGMCLSILKYCMSFQVIVSNWRSFALAHRRRCGGGVGLCMYFV